MLIAVMSLTVLCFGNPLIEMYINELLLDHDDPHNWTLEFKNTQRRNLDGHYLASQQGEAYFKDSIDWDQPLVVITEQDLKSSFRLVATGDRLELHEPDGNRIGLLTYGNVPGNFIDAPHQGYSISLTDYLNPQNDQVVFYYLDNTPTIGVENDKANGRIQGIVTDRRDTALVNVEVQFDWDSRIGPMWVRTDQQGFYEIYDESRRATLHFKLAGYHDVDTTIQIWPDSIVSLDVTMLDDPNDVEDVVDQVEPAFALYPSFPNPSTGEATIRYYLGLSDLVEVTIYDSQGKKIQTLFTGYEQYGHHELRWSTAHLQPGVFFYSLTTSSGEMTRKTVVINRGH